MMVLGLRLSKILSFDRNKFSIFTMLRTIWVVRSFVIIWKGRTYLGARHYSFTTLSCLSMWGMCSLAVAIFINDLPSRDSMRRQELWDFIHEKYVAHEKFFLVQLYRYYRYIHLIPGHYVKIVFVALPLSDAMFLPHIFCMTSISWTFTGQFLIYLLKITHL